LNTDQLDLLLDSLGDDLKVPFLPFILSFLCC